MNKKRTAILVAVLFGISIFSVVQYIASLKERQDLRNNLNRVNAEAAQLKAGNRYLNQELEQKSQEIEKLARERQLLKSNVRKNEEQLIRLQIQLSSAQRLARELRSQIERYKERRLVLEREKEAISEEKSLLEARFNSFAELKKAIRELKIKRRRRKVKVKIDKEPQPIKQKISTGNQGFIIKNGKATSSGKVTIKVIPLR